MSPEQITHARQKADTIVTMTARIEGCLLSIRDVAGFAACKLAAEAAIQRVARSGHDNDNDGYIA